MARKIQRRRLSDVEWQTLRRTPFANAKSKSAAHLLWYLGQRVVPIRLHRRARNISVHAHDAGMVLDYFLADYCLCFWCFLPTVVLRVDSSAACCFSAAVSGRAECRGRFLSCASKSAWSAAEVACS